MRTGRSKSRSRGIDSILASEWHKEKNRVVTFDNLPPGSSRNIFWWQCSKGPDHEWQASLNNRKSKGSGCPCCSGRKLSVTNSLAALFPRVAREWHPDKNEGLTPDEVLAGSRAKYWWKCQEGFDHIWMSTISNRTSGGYGCPCCAGQKASVTNSLRSKYPAMADQLHPDKNDGITADEIVAGSNRKYWWKCPEGPDHEWKTPVASRTHAGSGCPCCSGLQLSVTNSLFALFPIVAGLWHPEKNQGLAPDQILAGSNKKYWWKCPKGIDHEWDAQVTALSYTGTGCPYCAGQRLSVTNSLRALHPEIADELHPDNNGGVTADQILAGSSKRYSWQCLIVDSHQWKTTVDKRTSARRGCPKCIKFRTSAQEIQLAFELNIFFKFDIDDHKESVGDKNYDCDIIIRQHRLVVEFDSSYWHKDHFHRDKDKSRSLETAGWKVIRVREQPLPLTSQMDVSVPPLSKGTKPAVDSVLLKIRETLNIQIDRLDAYLKATGLQNSKASDAFIKRLLRNQKKAESPPLT